jgi:predicted lipoprotein with Yx(FWY)xxD motif
VVGKASAGAGLAAGDFGTVSRGSSTQITYQGHPLYEFSSDSKPGDEKGAGLTDQGGTWHPAGASASAKSGGGYGGHGGGGYP